MDRKVIIAMAVFVYFGILKDALVGFLMNKFYKNRGMDLN